MNSLLIRRRQMFLVLSDSPYSMETTRKLKTDFPNYWEDIKAYGIDNPSMVPYINEDPHLICSLMDVGILRGLKGDGQAFIDTTYVVSENDEIDVTFKGNSKTTTLYVLGAGNVSMGDGFTMIRANTSSIFGGGQPLVLNGTILSANQNTIGKFRTVINKNNLYSYVNDALIVSKSNTTTGFTNEYLRIYALKRKDNPLFDTTYLFNDSIYYLNIKNNNSFVYKLVPIKINNQCGFINLADNSILYKTNNSGTFTITEDTLPYANISSYARSVIKEDLGNTAWEAVKTYFSDSSKSGLVQYVNEDPYVIISLGLVSGVERWLVGDGDAYIDTLFTPNNNSGIYAKFKYATNDYGGFFGVRTDLSSGLFLIQKQSNLMPVIGYNTTRQIILEIALDDNTHEMSLIKNVGTLDETTFTFTSSTFTCIGSAILMGFRNGANILAYKPFVSDAKMWDNGTLIRDFMPCKNPNGNDYGMLDLVNGVFYPNANSTGSFSIEYSGLPFLNISSTTKNSIITAYGQDAWTVVKNFFTDPTTESLVASVNSDYTVVEELCGINGGGA